MANKMSWENVHIWVTSESADVDSDMKVLLGKWTGLGRMTDHSDRHVYDME